MRNDTFSTDGKLLVLRFTRLGRLPPARYAAEALLKKGFALLVIEYGNVREHKRKLPTPIPRLRISNRWAAYLPGRLRAAAIFAGTFATLFARFLIQGRPTLIVSHGLSEQVLAVLFYATLRIPYAAHVHEVYEGRELSTWNRLYLLLEGTALRHAKFLLFPEKQRAEIYQQRYNFKTPVVIVFNCPPLQNKLEPVNLRRELGLESHASLLGYFGGLGKWNLLEDGIRAVARIPKMYFLLWGWGDKSYVESLKELARGVGAADRVLFLGELPENKWSYVSALDLSYCLYEPGLLRLRFAATASNKLMESLAAGVPVITNNASDFQELVVGQDVGQCVPESSVDAIAGTLRTLSRDTLGLKRRSENARTCHLSHFNFEALFESAIPYFEKYAATRPEALAQSAATGS